MAQPHPPLPKLAQLRVRGERRQLATGWPLHARIWAANGHVGRLAAAGQVAPANPTCGPATVVDAVLHSSGHELIVGIVHTQAMGTELYNHKNMRRILLSHTHTFAFARGIRKTFTGLEAGLSFGTPVSIHTPWASREEQQKLEGRRRRRRPRDPSDGPLARGSSRVPECAPQQDGVHGVGVSALHLHGHSRRSCRGLVLQRQQETHAAAPEVVAAAKVWQEGQGHLGESDFGDQLLWAFGGGPSMSGPMHRSMIVEGSDVDGNSCHEVELAPWTRGLHGGSSRA